MRLVLLVLIFACSKIALSQDPCAIIWDPPIQLSDSTYTAILPRIALSGDDTIHVGWVEDIGQIHRLPYMRSINGLWEPIRDLIVDTVQFPVRMFENRIVTDYDNVYVFGQRGQDPHNRNVMSKSTDRGTSWTTTYIATDTAAGLYSANARQDTLVVHYMQTRNGYNVRPRLIYSTNGGAAWYERPDTFRPNSRTELSKGTLHLAENVIVNSPQGVAQEIVYRRSFDLGSTWRDVDTLSSVDGEFAYEMAMASGQLDSAQGILLTWRDGIACAAFIGCTIIGREGHTNGLDWRDPSVFTEIPRGTEPAVSIAPTGGAAIAWTDEITASTFHIVIRTRHGGDTSWCPIVDLTPFPRGGGQPSVVVSSKAIHVVWCEGFPDGSLRIIYRLGRFMDTRVGNDLPAVPPFAHLEQNYPNPFNPTTSIRFRIDTREFVNLSVYDMVGREVAMLVRETKNPGEYTAEWSASKMATGVYYYRLIAGGKIEIKKAILVR